MVYHIFYTIKIHFTTNKIHFSEDIDISFFYGIYLGTVVVTYFFLVLLKITLKQINKSPLLMYRIFFDTD